MRREDVHLQLKSLGLQLSPFPIRSQGRQYGSFLLYLLQNMEDNCFVMKNDAIFYKLDSCENSQPCLVANIRFICQCTSWFASNTRLLRRNWKCLPLAPSHDSCMEFPTEIRVHCFLLQGGSWLLKDWLSLSVKYFCHTVGSALIVSLDEHASLSPKVKQTLENSL